MRWNEPQELLPDMGVFFRVIDKGSFTAAAQATGQTPSAVSRQVSRLEKRLGVRLLMRTTRKLCLTEAGKAVFQASQAMMTAAHSATEAARGFVDKPQGVVRGSAPMTFGKIVVSPLIPRFLQQCPAVDVQLLLTDRVVDLIDDAMDFVIRIEQTPPPGVIARHLMDVRYVLCASPSYLARRGCPTEPSDLLQHDCLFFGDTEHDDQWTLRHGEHTTRVDVRGRYIVNHSEAMVEAVESGVGIGFLPQFTAATRQAQGSVVQVLPDWTLETPYQGTAWLMYLPDRHLPPKNRLIIDHLCSSVAAAPGHRHTR